MSYLGRGLDKISNIEILDNITFDGSSSYSITKSSVAFVPNSAQSLLISIDGVVQATNFTISGSTIDFGVAVPSTSTCNFFLHYGTGVAFIPTDGSVTEAKIADSSVSLAKLTATGTKDATTFLRGDNTFSVPSRSSDAFHAYDMSSNASGTLVLTSELLDDGGNYNTSNGRYTAPSAGKYHFYCSAVSTANADSYINFHLNGSVINGGTDQGGNTPNTATQGIMMMTIDLNANDYVTMVSQNNVYSNYIFFGGYKLY